MEEREDQRELEAAVESILFASGEPVHIDRFCVALSLERAEVEEILCRLRDYYAFERRGIRLLQLEDSWQLCSSPDHGEVVRKAFEIRKPAKLSQPALEALTILLPADDTRLCGQAAGRGQQLYDESVSGTRVN